MSVASGPSPRSLPTPIIDPADVMAVLPALSPEDASLYASLATLALESIAWPNELPAAPLPAPLYQVGLSLACRLAVAGEATGESVGQVVSESIGAYTYRLATPATLDSALYLSDAERKLIRPWIGQAGAYDVTLGGAYYWPPEWWQRDLDNPLKAVEAEVVAAP